MSDKKLKRCPFCNGKAKVYKMGMWYYIQCRRCHCMTTQILNKEDINKVWNTRNYLEKQDSSNSSEIPNSSKEMPLVPKWKVWGYNDCILKIPISQQDALQFVVRSFKDNKYMCEVGISVSEVEEIGTFNTLKEAKQKANECIRELGERLVCFAENIKTKE